MTAPFDPFSIQGIETAVGSAFGDPGLAGQIGDFLGSTPEQQQRVGTAVGGLFGGPLGAAAGGQVATGIGSFFQPGVGHTAPGTAMIPFSSGAGVVRARGVHPNRSSYMTRAGLVQKGTKMVRNRRRNAGNAKAVRRALGRLAMFDNLARKVEAEMSRVARRHHRAAPRRSHGSHRAGCRCFRCRR